MQGNARLRTDMSKNTIFKASHEKNTALPDHLHTPPSLLQQALTLFGQGGEAQVPSLVVQQEKR